MTEDRSGMSENLKQRKEMDEQSGIKDRLAPGDNSDVKAAQERAEAKARESEQTAKDNPDLSSRPVPERGPDPTPPADEANIPNDNPNPGGKAPSPLPEKPKAPTSPNLQPRNSIPPNPGEDRGGGVSA